MDNAHLIRAAAPAKLNLYLHVTGKRHDGYHTLDSLVCFAGIGDTITVRPAATITLSVDGPFAARIPEGPDNLVLKAAHGLARAAGLTTGAAITLTKRLPPSSGIGGGSADAAATLRALSELWGVQMEDHAVMALALSLGADVPVCLNGRSVFMGGIGEKLSPAPDLPSAWVVLVNPGVPVSTPPVFKARTGPFSEPAPFNDAPADARALAALLGERTNDLQAPATTLAPVIGDVLDALKNARDIRLARMSGSGATCFGLFDDVAAAGEAAAQISVAHGDWWVAAAPLIHDVRELDL